MFVEFHPDGDSRVMKEIRVFFNVYMCFCVLEDEVVMQGGFATKFDDCGLV